MRLATIFVFFLTFIIITQYAKADDEDIFADYNKDIKKEANAKTSNIYDAWGDNMADLIRRGKRKGVVIDGPGDYANGKVHADGVGNVYVEKGAKPGTIINRPKIDNSTVVIKNTPQSGSRSRW